MERMQPENPFDCLQVARDQRGIVYATLDRADKHNALNPQMIAELARLASVVDRDPAARALVLTGAGDRSFCAGADLGWMREQAANSRPGRIEESRSLAAMLRALDHVRVPLIARVNGQAYGGGLGLMSVADITIAVSTARFAFTEAKLGILPANIGPFVLRRMGPGAARSVFLHARAFGAEEAQRLGLVHHVAEPDALDAAVEREITALLACAPGAVAHAKALLHAIAADPSADHTLAAATALADAWESEEAAAGIRAFFDRTKPPWAEDA